MPGRFKNNQRPRGRSSWREYQEDLKKETLKRGLPGRIPKYSAVVAIACAIAYAGFYGVSGSAYHQVREDSSLSTPEISDAASADTQVIKKADLHHLLAGKSLLNLKDKSFTVTDADHSCRVDTSLSIPLQQYLIRKLNTSTSRYIGIVVMDPSLGRVLAMVGFDKTGTSDNPCLDNRFPAASVFKIVTAAAAIETCGLGPKSMLKYNGSKHTLYKSQLKDETNRYTNQVTLRDSFAQSINPVFGKLGANCLGKDTLKKYAAAFGFNREIDFAVLFPASVWEISDVPYRWAEIASGFNREIRISPLHGALMASAILNQGRLPEPTIIDQITDENGKILYIARKATIGQAITPRVCKDVHDLMRATVSSGTSRKAFQGYRKDRVLSKLSIGGKTGSIDTENHDARYDWFVGFAQEKGGSGSVVISVVVAHEKYIGTRASTYARMAMKQYFRDYFALREEQTKNAKG